MEGTLRELTQNVTFSAGKPPRLRQPDGIIFIRIPNSRKFLLMESVIQGFGIQNSTQKSGIPLTIGIRNSSSTVNESGIQVLLSRKFHGQGIRNPVPGIRHPQRGIHNTTLHAVAINQPAPLINSYHVYCYFLWQ